MFARNRTAARRKAALLAGTALCALSVVDAAHAQSFWSGGAGDWFDPGNWTAGVPDAGDTAIVNNGGTAQIGAAGAVSGIGSAGETAGNSGAVAIDGAGSTWTIGNTLYVGNSGTGTLDVTDGGAVSNHNGALGNTATGSGTATIDGVGSTWTNGGQLTIGGAGEGTLEISGGGAVSNTAGTIGSNAGGIGEVTVDGADSQWTNSGDLVVGSSGTAGLNITGGGTVSNASGYVGDLAAGEGTVAVGGSGSSWINSGHSLVIGWFGTATLDISDGGSVSGTAGYIGRQGGSTGSATVDGANSIWTNSGELYIGDRGSGALDILDGGVVSNTNGYIANQAGSSGDVAVDGAGSEWNLSGNLAVGNSGDATLAISGGGAVSNVDALVGYFAAGSSAVTVDGAGAIWSNSGELTIGVWGGATLDIADGGAVSNTTGYIGRHATGDGEVTVSGAGSTWTSSSTLYVGDSGTGTLTLAAGGAVEAGTVTIASNASSTGTLNIGAAAGDAAAGAGTLDAASLAFGAGTGTLVFNHTGTDYLFGAAISGAGEVRVESGETILTAAATHTGGTAISGGTLQLGNGGTAGALAGDLVNDGTFAIDRSNAYTYAGVMSGSGDFRQTGTGATTLTGDSSAFAGSIFVEAGMLIVNGILGGTLNVTGALLGGSGTVGATTLGAGATVAPGNSIGTLNVSGDFAFDALSIYEVEVNDGGDTSGVNNDFIDIGGSLTIDSGASVWVTPRNGTDDGSTYTPGLVYAIIEANGGITGTFGSVGTDMAFLSPELSYDVNTVYLSLLHAADFEDVAQTPNQKGVAQALQMLGAGNLLYDVILGMTDTQARAAFRALSGESHANSPATAFLGAQQIRQQILARLANLFGGNFGSGGTGGVVLAGAPAAGDAVPGAASVWGQLFGSWGRTDGNVNNAALARNSYGFVGGIDREIGDGLQAGVAFGYSRGSYDVRGLASSGDSDNFHIAGYAGRQFGQAHVKGALSYSYGHTEAQRNVVVGGVTSDLSASYGAHTFQASIDAGYDLDLGPVVLTPFAGLAAIHVETEGFTETGGPAALTFAAQGNTTGVSTLGLRARRQAGSVGMTGSLAWRHAFGDVEPASRAAFASAPANPFTVRGAPIAENTLALETAVDLRLADRTTLTFGYAGEYASDARDHGLRAELRFEF